jgi:hypothetical protein
MTLADHIKILDNLQDLDAHYPNISVSATYDFYTGTTSVYIDSDLGFTFTDYKGFRKWYINELLLALEEGVS